MNHANRSIAKPKKDKITHGVCTTCGCATGVVKVKTQVLFDPVKTEFFCAHCVPHLHR